MVDKLRIEILGSGKYLPSRKVPSSEIDLRLNLRPGTVESKTGVKVRSFIQNESLSDMARYATESALKNARLNLRDIDLIISAGASPEQIIPSNATLFQKALGKEAYGIPCFDVDATCLSFMTAFDLASSYIAVGRYRRILIISSEIASLGLHDEDIETAGLFGDAAVAVIIGPTPPERPGEIIDHLLLTYSDCSDLCEIIGGGSRLPGYRFDGANRNQYLFQMSGPKLFKQAMKHTPEALDRILKRNTQSSFSEIKYFIPHQASGSAMELMRRKLNCDEKKWVNILENHGNCIAASLPMGLHELIETKAIERGDLLMMIGTGAGISVGLTLFRY